MRNFIREHLRNVRDRRLRLFDYKYVCADGDVIELKGSADNGIATFRIERTKANGHNCSAVPVYDMPLVDGCIEQVVELAVEAL